MEGHKSSCERRQMSDWFRRWSDWCDAVSLAFYKNHVCADFEAFFLHRTIFVVKKEGICRLLITVNEKFL